MNNAAAWNEPPTETRQHRFHAKNPPASASGLGAKIELSPGLGGVVADGFHWAGFLGFLAAGFFVRGGRLLVNEGVTPVVIALEIVRRRFPAQVAINALVVHVVFAGNVFSVFICSVSHKILLVD
jgi:hypothetical protein